MKCCPSKKIGCFGHCGTAILPTLIPTDPAMMVMPYYMNYTYKNATQKVEIMLRVDDKFEIDLSKFPDLGEIDVTITNGDGNTICFNFPACESCDCNISEAQNLRPYKKLRLEFSPTYTTQIDLSPTEVDDCF